MRFVSFERPVVLLGWGGITPWGRGASAWSDQPPRRVDAGDEVARLADLPDLAARRLDRFGLLALAAAREAFASMPSIRDTARFGVVLGSAHGCAASNRAYGEDQEKLNHRELRPALFVRTLSSVAAADVSIALQLHGASQTFVSGCTAGVEAFVAAAALDGRYLVGGVEAPPGGETSWLEGGAFAVLIHGGGPNLLRLKGASLGRDVEGDAAQELITDCVSAGCDLVVIANPVPPGVMSLWRQAAGRGRVLDLGAHGNLGATGAVLGAGLAVRGCDRGAVVVARDPSGETALLRFER